MKHEQEVPRTDDAGLRVIPVIDLRRGLVVRGVAGDREHYEPLVSPWARDARPETVLRGIERQFAPREIYVADLDAIMDQTPDERVWRQLARSNTPLLLDAGLTDVERAVQCRELARRLGLNKVRWIVGLESLISSDVRELSRFVETLGPENSLFSLDLHGGRLLTHPAAQWPEEPAAVVDLAGEAGFRALIVLDLAHVGCQRGVGVVELVRQLRSMKPTWEWISGGGVRTRNDLLELAKVGCQGALVATALHQGRLTPDDMWIPA